VHETRQITQLLQAASRGDEQARNSLFDTVYQELRAIARAHRRRWHGNETLNTTALIHEAYVKLASSDTSNYEDRTHFFATASKAMRQILINYAERNSAAKRGSDAVRVTLSGNMPVTEDCLDDLLIIEELLLQLEEQSVRQCRLFECRVFGGMTIDETATALDISPATVKRDWGLISAWIYREVNQSKATS
jgi:RNA polymerase sigma factor (TIGR02999 family)